ncbi:MAG TPA: hypothetical protein VF742_02930 [Terracidiphilus sp.]
MGMEIALRRETAESIRVKIPRTLSRQQEQELLESARQAAQAGNQTDHTDTAQIEAVR